MTQSELDALIEKGLDALKATQGLSGEEQQIVNRAIAKLEASTDAPAEEPARDSESEPKAAKSRRIIPRRGGTKGKK